MTSVTASKTNWKQKNTVRLFLDFFQITLKENIAEFREKKNSFLEYQPQLASEKRTQKVCLLLLLLDPDEKKNQDPEETSRIRNTTS